MSSASFAPVLESAKADFLSEYPGARRPGLAYYPPVLYDEGGGDEAAYGFPLVFGVEYGYRSRPLSGGGQGLVGTTSLNARTLMSLVEDVIGALVDQGFRRIALVNWHFENQNFIYEAAYLALERHQDSSARIVIAEHPFAELSQETLDVLFPSGFAGWDVEHAAGMETSLMLHLRPELVVFDRAVDDASERHPWYDVLPVPEDFVPESGTLWKATQASAEQGKTAWWEIVAQFRTAIVTELEATGDKSHEA